MLNPMSSTKTLDRAVVEEISKGWWILLLSGIVSLVAGVVILTAEWTVADLALFVAILFIVRGVLQAMTRTIDGSDRSWNIAVGVLEIAVGIAFVSWPDVGLYTVAVFIGAWVVVSGAFDLLGAIAHRHDVGVWWLFAIVGVIQLGLGLALLDRPALTLALAITVVGIWAVVAGVIQMLAAFDVKHLPELVDRVDQG